MDETRPNRDIAAEVLNNVCPWPDAPKRLVIPLSMFQIEAALCEADLSKDGHRGLWAVPAADLQGVRPGHLVRFVDVQDDGRILAEGLITELMDYPEMVRRIGGRKTCSAVNDSAFAWTDKPAIDCDCT